LIADAPRQLRLDANLMFAGQNGGELMTHDLPTTSHPGDVYWKAVAQVASGSDTQVLVEYKRLLGTASYARSGYPTATAHYAAALAESRTSLGRVNAADEAMIAARKAYEDFQARRSSDIEAFMAALDAASTEEERDAIIDADFAKADAPTETYCRAAEDYLSSGVPADPRVLAHISAAKAYLSALSAYVDARTAKAQAGRTGEDPSVTQASIALAKARDSKNVLVPKVSFT
jgi:hypothetical protein